MNNLAHQRNKSLRGGLALLAAMLVAISAVTVFALTTVRDLHSRYETLRNDVLTEASTLADLSVFAVYTRNRSELNRILNAAGMRKETRFLMLRDVRGQDIARRLYQGDDSLAEAPWPIGGKLSKALIVREPGFWGILRGEDLIVAAPVNPAADLPPQFGDPGASLAAEPIGCLLIGVSTRVLRANAMADLAAAMAAVALLVLIAAYFAVVITRRLAAPIGELANMADRIASGELGISVAPGNYDEIRTLGNAFNRMSERLRQAQGELQNQNLELERKVAERTQALQAAAKHAHQLAQHDNITGLPNRALLGTRLHFAFAAAERRRDRVAVVVIDIHESMDTAKTPTNDGVDDLLRAAGARLASVARINETVARSGPAEFTVVVPDIDGVTSDNLIADRVQSLREVLALPLAVATEPIRLYPSIGVSIFPDDGTEPRLVLVQARDAARPSSEREPCGYHSRDAAVRIHRRSRIEERLKDALRGGAIHSRHATVFDLVTGAPARLWLNLSWRHPELGPLSPEEFFPAATHAGLQLEMLRLALQDAAAFAQGSIGHGLPIGVHVWPAQFEDPRFAAAIATHLDALPAGARPTQLIVPESAIGADIGAAIIILRELKQAGIEVTVQDFGAGHASLSDLVHLPIEAAALDASIVRGLAHSASDRALLQAYVHMAHSLDIRVIASGITTRAEVEYLIEQGCDEGLGPYWETSAR